MLAFAALLLSAQGGLVTVEFAPTPLPKALEALSVATGRRLECAPALRDEFLLARLKDADPERVMKEVAFSLDARWEAREDGRRVLLPDLAAARMREAAARRTRETVVTARFQSLAAELAKQPAAYGKADGARYRKLLDAFAKAKEKAARTGSDEELYGVGPDEEFDGNAVPAWRALARLLAALGPRPFLALVAGERVVWSDAPTPMQRPLGPIAGNALGAYRREYAQVDPRASVARFRLVAQDDGDGDVTVHFAALDPRGREIEGADESLTRAGSDDDAPDEDAKAGPAKKPAGKPLELPEETREYLALLNYASKATRDETFRRWEPRIADPVAYEPTRPFPGLVLLAAAAGRGCNLIGTVPDAFGAAYGGPGGRGAAEFFEEIEGALWTLRDGWIVVRTDAPGPRVPRAEGRALLQRALSQGGLDVDAAADWATRFPPEAASMTWFGTSLGALISLRSMVETLDADGLRLWSALPPTARAALRAGSTVPLAALPAGAREELQREVYWQDALGTQESEGGEVTEMLPNGIPDGALALTATEEAVFAAWSAASGEPVFRIPYLAARYGVLQGQGERRGKPVEFDRFRPGLARRYTLKIVLGPRLSFDRTMAETFLDLRSAPVDRLPEAFLRRADEARKEFLARPAPPRPGGAQP